MISLLILNIMVFAHTNILPIHTLIKINFKNLIFIKTAFIIINITLFILFCLK